MNNREKFIVIIDNDFIEPSDAIVLLEGDGNNRCSTAIQLYKSGFAPTIIFSGGITNYTYGSFPFSEIKPILLTEGIPDAAIIHENKSLNTKEQAIEVIKIAEENNWKRLILVASNYHQYRAYLTFLRQIIDTKLNIILFNAPARELEWFIETGWGKRFDLLDQEFEKIEKYSELSHLASFEEALKYQKWKEQQISKLQK